MEGHRLAITFLLQLVFLIIDSLLRGYLYSVNDQSNKMNIYFKISQCAIYSAMGSTMAFAVITISS